MVEGKAIVRTLALGLVIAPGPRLWVARGYDRVKDEVFYRPPGGGIQFGERGRETVIRAVMEEFSIEVNQTFFEGMIENIFTYQGRMGHEIILLYRCSFSDRSLYERDSFSGVDNKGDPISAFFIPIELFYKESHKLYPRALLDKLQSIF